MMADMHTPLAWVRMKRLDPSKPLRSTTIKSIADNWTAGGAVVVPVFASQDAETIKALRVELQKAEMALDDLANGRGLIDPIEKTIAGIRAALAGSAS